MDTHGGDLVGTRQVRLFRAPARARGRRHAALGVAILLCGTGHSVCAKSAAGTQRSGVWRQIRTSPAACDPCLRDRKSVVWVKSVLVRVDLGGPRTITKKKHSTTIT